MQRKRISSRWKQESVECFQAGAIDAWLGFRHGNECQKGWTLRQKGAYDAGYGRVIHRNAKKQAGLIG